MRTEPRLSLNVERDWTWEEWPEYEPMDDYDTWEDEGLTVSDTPAQAVLD